MMSTDNSPRQLSTEHCINPSEAISKARSIHNSQSDDNDSFDDIDADEWNENIKITGVQEREWILTEIEYYTISEKREDFEFPLSKDVPQNNSSDPFETDKITIYEEVSTEDCSICGGEGVSPCEACSGDGEIRCPNNCHNGEIKVECSCRDGEVLDDCPECGGDKTIWKRGEKRMCHECNRDGEQYRTHSRCGGKGWVEKRQCEVCTGEPPIDKQGIIECTDCSSPEHKNTCNNCEGEGTTYHGIRIERSHNVEVEKTIEDDIPEEVFERHADYVTVNEYDSDSVPSNVAISEEVQSAVDFRIIKKRLEGYDINYIFSSKEIKSTVIGDDIYRSIPKVSETGTYLSVIAGIGVFVLWLGGFVYLIESPRFESPLWLTANFLIGLPIAFILYGALSSLPGMEQYQVGTYDIGF